MSSRNINILDLHDRIQNQLRETMRNAPEIKKQVKSYDRLKTREGNEIAENLRQKYKKAMEGYYEAYYILRTRSIVEEFRQDIEPAHRVHY